MSHIEKVADYKHCRDCVYKMYLGGSAMTPFCGYILVEKESRGCSVSKCTRRREGKRNFVGFTMVNRKYDIEDKEDE